MKTVPDILAEIDRRLLDEAGLNFHQNELDEFSDGKIDGLRRLKSFILQPSAECGHEWDFESSICIKCREIKP